MTVKIKVINLKKQFNTKWIIKGLDLEIPEKQMTIIIGRSGEGKSVLLKQIIGLIRPTSGEIIVDGVDITQLSEIELNKHFEKFGYVFQFAALLDSLTVFENIGITLLESGIAQDKVLSIVKKKLALVQLEEDTLQKYPSELSGGMRKRVGIVRTLITNPNIILYDEPTTGLDPITARVIHQLMFSIQKKLHLTSVVISHDIETLQYADNVALLYDGTIKFFGNAKKVWESDNPYIYQFIRGLPEGPIQTEIPHVTHLFDK